MRIRFSSHPRDGCELNRILQRARVPRGRLDLNTRARIVACALAKHMDRNGGSCYPGVARLARESGYSERTVQRSLAELEAVGFLVRTGKGGRAKSNSYFATLPETVTKTVTPDSETVTPVPETVTTTTGNGDTGVTQGRSERTTREDERSLYRELSSGDANENPVCPLSRQGLRLLTGDDDDIEKFEACGCADCLANVELRRSDWSF